MKRYVMEFVGTFFLAVAIAMIGNPLSIGIMLMAMAFVGGHISGGHFNPAISFACFIQNKLKLIDLGYYIAAQSFGALLAVWLFNIISNNVYTLDMVPGSYIAGPLATEAIFALVLCWVYLAMCYDSYHKDGKYSSIVIGLTLLGIAFAGGLFNPAVAIASTVFSCFKEGIYMQAGTMIVYVAGPMIGAAGASFLFGYFGHEA